MSVSSLCLEFITNPPQVVVWPLPSVELLRNEILYCIKHRVGHDVITAGAWQAVIYVIMFLVFLHLRHLQTAAAVVLRLPSSVWSEVWRGARVWQTYLGKLGVGLLTLSRKVAFAAALEADACRESVLLYPYLYWVDYCLSRMLVFVFRLQDAGGLTPVVGPGAFPPDTPVAWVGAIRHPAPATVHYTSSADEAPASGSLELSTATRLVRGASTREGAEFGSGTITSTPSRLLSPSIAGTTSLGVHNGEDENPSPSLSTASPLQHRKNPPFAAPFRFRSRYRTPTVKDVDEQDEPSAFPAPAGDRRHASTTAVLDLYSPLNITFLEQHNGQRQSESRSRPPPVDTQARDTYPGQRSSLPLTQDALKRILHKASPLLGLSPSKTTTSKKANDDAGTSAPNAIQDAAEDRATPIIEQVYDCGNEPGFDQGHVLVKHLRDVLSRCESVKGHVRAIGKHPAYRSTEEGMDTVLRQLDSMDTALKSAWSAATSDLANEKALRRLEEADKLLPTITVTIRDIGSINNAETILWTTASVVMDVQQLRDKVLELRATAIQAIKAPGNIAASSAELASTSTKAGQSERTGTSQGEERSAPQQMYNDDGSHATGYQQLHRSDSRTLPRGNEETVQASEANVPTAYQTPSESQEILAKSRNALYDAEPDLVRKVWKVHEVLRQVDAQLQEWTQWSNGAPDPRDLATGAPIILQIQTSLYFTASFLEDMVQVKPKDRALPPAAFANAAGLASGISEILHHLESRTRNYPNRANFEKLMSPFAHRIRSALAELNQYVEPRPAAQTMPRAHTFAEAVDDKRSRVFPKDKTGPSTPHNPPAVKRRRTDMPPGPEGPSVPESTSKDRLTQDSGSPMSIDGHCLEDADRKWTLFEQSVLGQPVSPAAPLDTAQRLKTMFEFDGPSMTEEEYAVLQRQHHELDEMKETFRQIGARGNRLLSYPPLRADLFNVRCDELVEAIHAKILDKLSKMPSHKDQEISQLKQKLERKITAQLNEFYLIREQANEIWNTDGSYSRLTYRSERLPFDVPVQPSTAQTQASEHHSASTTHANPVQKSNDGKMKADRDREAAQTAIKELEHRAQLGNAIFAQLEGHLARNVLTPERLAARCERLRQNVEQQIIPQIERFAGHQSSEVRSRAKETANGFKGRLFGPDLTDEASAQHPSAGADNPAEGAAGDEDVNDNAPQSTYQWPANETSHIDAEVLGTEDSANHSSNDIPVADAGARSDNAEPDSNPGPEREDSPDGTEHLDDESSPDAPVPDEFEVREDSPQTHEGPILTEDAERERASQQVREWNRSRIARDAKIWKSADKTWEASVPSS